MFVCVWLTPCVAQFAACSYSVGWYLLLAGTLQFMNLRERERWVKVMYADLEANQGFIS